MTIINLRRLVWACLALAAPLASATPSSTPVSLYGAEQFSLPSKHTGKIYRVYISKPDTPAPAGGYPVLYALDGDFSFPVLHVNHPRAASVFQRMAQRGGAQPEAGVVIGIGYGRDYAETSDLRASDYTITDACQPCDQLSPQHGGAAQFARFVDEELRPAIASRIPINPARASLLGHSYGGLFTLYHFFTRAQQPQRFAQYFAISPSIWFGERAILSQVPRWPTSASAAQAAQPTVLALWVGADEEPLTLQSNHARLQRLQQNRMVSNVGLLAGQLQGLPGLVLDHRVIAGHDHGQMHMYALDRITDLAFQAAPPSP
jgi:uncharacterized protein